MGWGVEEGTGEEREKEGLQVKYYLKKWTNIYPSWQSNRITQYLNAKCDSKNK